MEKTLQLILEKVTSMESKITTIESDLKEVKDDIKELKSDVKELDRKMTNIYEHTHDLTEFETETKESLQRIEYKVDRTDNDVINIKTNLKVVQ